MKDPKDFSTGNRIFFVLPFCQAGIAGDQAVIEKLCGLGTTAGLDQSLAVYEQGGHSKSFAEITITGGLQTTVLKGTNMEQGSISGKALEDTPSGSPTIKMQYSTSDSVLEYVNCKVGGLPDDETVTAGCKLRNRSYSVERYFFLTCLPLFSYRPRAKWSYLHYWSRRRS